MGCFADGDDDDDEEEEEEEEEEEKKEEEVHYLAVWLDSELWRMD